MKPGPMPDAEELQRYYAEQSLIGYAMLEALAIDDSMRGPVCTAVASVDPKEMKWREHRIGLAYIRGAVKAGGFLPDKARIAQWAASTGVPFDEVVDVLWSCWEAVDARPTVEKVRPLIELVRRENMLQATLKKVREAGLYAGKSVDELRAIVERAIEVAGDGSSPSDVMAEVEARLAGQRADVPTCIGELDMMLDGGIERGTLTVVAARTGVGKSAFALGMVLDLARRGVSSVLYSTEMSAVELTKRALAILSGMPVRRLRREPEERRRAADEMRRLPVVILDSMSDLAAILADAAVRVRGGARVVVIDHLQHVRLAGDGEQAAHGAASRTRAEELGEITRTLRRWAARQDVAVLLTSQLSRAAVVVDKGGERQPELQHLRDSGRIEEDADKVIFIWRPKRLAEDGKARLIVAKNRQGRAGVWCDVRWDSETARFVDLWEGPEDRPEDRFEDVVLE